MSVMVKVPARLPAAVGANVTLMVQFAPADTLPPQLSFSAKSVAFVPLIARLKMMTAAFPVLLNVIDCAVLVAPAI